MPQMSPMWWTTLFLMNIMLIYVMMTSIYFMPYMFTSKKYKLNKNNFNWSW